MKTKTQGRKRRGKSQFPLYLHATGQWAKTIRGKKHYFGTDKDEAIDAYLAQKDHLYAGRSAPEVKPVCMTVGDAIGSFRSVKESAFSLGELTEQTLVGYKAICQTISRVLGKNTPMNEVTTTDLVRLKARIAKGKKGKPTSPISLKRKLTCARSVFLHANEELGCSIRYRKPLASPSAKMVRKHRHEIGQRLFTPKEIRALIEAAGPQMKAMILLGVTCGMGNRDVASLPIEQIDLEGGWHNYWRPKTQNPRRAALTPECAAAIYKVIKGRRSGLVFMTKYGQPWFREVGRACPISHEFRKLCKKVGIYKPNVTQFYSLRRTCQTVGEASGELQAVRFLMGHVAPTNDMSSVYRQRVWDSALARVAEFIRKWIAGEIVLR